MAASLTKLNNEVLTALCTNCKCCLADSAHCHTCHINIPIEDLCGCGNCKAKADDFLERVKLSLAKKKMRGGLNLNG